MLLLVVSLVLATGPQTAPPQTAPPAVQPAPVQRRTPPPPYNPTADAKAQIAGAIKSAGEDGIRVLLNFGANDDASSTAFETARRNAALRTFFADEYKVVNVDVGHADKNIDVARAYGVTLTPGALPHLAVLDATGAIIAQAPGQSFRSDADSATYDPEKLQAFLKKHQAPPPPDAEPSLQTAVKQAAAGGKSVFVWFSAPW
jgi:hypothetical protein